MVDQFWDFICTRWPDLKFYCLAALTIAVVISIIMCAVVATPPSVPLFLASLALGGLLGVAGCLIVAVGFTAAFLLTMAAASVGCALGCAGF